jgi:hypothetical protein
MSKAADDFVADFDRQYESMRFVPALTFDPFKNELTTLEAEKEELQDLLNDARATIKDQEDIVASIRAENESLLRENHMLMGLPPIEEGHEDYVEGLSDAVAIIARCKAANKELAIAKEKAEKKMIHERNLRIHSEKERDAYAAAFNSSMGHFEKWTASKNISMD